MLNGRVNIFSLARRINRPLILDGAMGSLLQQKGIEASGALWMSKANLEQPETVYEIHKEYILAGADIITTNTFRTNPEALKYSGLDVSLNEFVKSAVEITVQSAGNLPVFVAGSNAPAEDCYKKERSLSVKSLEENHRKHIELLMNYGCDFILNETQSHFDEIEIICRFCSSENIPYIISLFVDESLNILSGESIEEVIKFIQDYNPLAIGINCVMPGTFAKLIEANSFNFNWGAYLNCGSGNFEDEHIQCGVSPKEYIETIKPFLKINPSFIGSCCGSSPEHTKEIKRIIDEYIPS